MDHPPKQPVTFEEFSYTDAYGIEITVYRWYATVEDPIGVVQIMHGIGEHAKRYTAFAEELVHAGFVVYADDHRGHGETGRTQWGGDLTKLGRLGPGGLRATEDAILHLSQMISVRHPGLPLIAFAHSWGSLMVQRITNSHPRSYDAVILSGSAYRTPLAMESGDLNTKWSADDASGFEWLSRDPAVAAEFLADPLCFEADILRLFGVADGLRLYGTPSKNLAPDVPIYIVSGAEDPLHRGERNLRKLADAYRARGVRDVSLKLYPGARHEMLNETNAAQVYADLITWMTDRVDAG
ncbi:MAG: alpha/beta fold hydrolase [Leucobacter sp.]